MRVLAIETSCDETAIAIVEAEGTAEGAQFRILGNALLSQIDIHREYGGVFPALAKREHAKNLVPILTAALEEAELLREDAQVLPDATRSELAALLEREEGLAEALLSFLTETERPEIDAIAVTAGPGLEPALWVGVNFAKALALVWEKPLIAVNHMEGHILAALAQEPPENAVSTRSPGTRSDLVIQGVEMPALALLISGGHTELVLMREWLRYERIGETRDDAVGEAFDKVARTLALPYPGGPEISKLAEAARAQDSSFRPFVLPRPMLSDATCDFSFAGLKTAVLYLVRDKNLSDIEKQALAQEFEDAVAEVLWKKSARALEETGAKTLLIGGGVSANTHIRRIFERESAKIPDLSLCIPSASLTTDNAVMIALAGYYRAVQKDFADPSTLRASGNLRL